MKLKLMKQILPLLLIGIALAAMLVGCGNSQQNTTAATQGSITKSTATTANSSDSRIDKLLKVWSDAGLNVTQKNKLESSTINSMYGCICHYQVYLDNQMVTILEYDLNNLNSTGERYIKFIDDNGYDSKTDDPAWHSQEFILRNTSSVLKDGAFAEKYTIEDHPKRDQILAAFAAFK